MSNSREKDIISIKNAWEKMVSGQPAETKKISPIVYESWQRSLQAGVNPYELDKGLFLTEKEIKYFSDIIWSEVQEDIVSVLKEIASKMKLVFSLYDRKGKIKKILAFSQDLESRIPRDISEDVLGTNGACLALRHDIPIQLLGDEHFSHLTPQSKDCFSAPVHDVNGNIIYVLAVGSISQDPTIETLGLVTSIAKIVENNIRINHILSKLAASNSTLNTIIEYNSSCILYLTDDKNISYNRALLNLFEIKETADPQIIFKNIQKILDQIDAYKNNKEIENKELLLNVNNKRRSYLVSMKRILNNKEDKGCLFRFVDTHELLRLNSKRSNAIYRFDDIVGENAQIKELKELAKKAARTSSAILIYGESGTGKELFAQAIHNESRRKDKPFIAINCGAIPSELIESELFGYEPGAFTGASKGTKLGKLEAASSGTFFFDEVESMPLNVQIKLLRALSINKITRIGGVKEIPIDIRIVAATKKDLLQEAEKGNFREDLYFRINIISLNIPPLRERKDDIPLLANSFINYFVRQENLPEFEAAPEFMEALTYYYWRGNVRELRNVIEKATLLSEDNKLTINNLPPKIIDAYRYKSLKAKVAAEISAVKKNRNILQAGEEMIIDLILNEEKGNLTKAAERLGISRPTLYKKIELYPKLRKRKDALRQG